MATIIRADGSHEVAQAADGKAWTLEELRAVVGGSIELIVLPGGRIMYVNEDGMALRLPPNDKATEVVSKYAPQYLWGGGWIIGDTITLTAEEVQAAFPEDEEDEDVIE